MRPIERIDNFLKLVNWNKLWKYWKLDDSYRLNILGLLSSKISYYWKENSDQRFGQVLINLNLIPDRIDIWLAEESEILALQGIPLEEYLFWGSIYDKDGNAIPLTYRLINTLDTEHIDNIYSHMFKHDKQLSQQYRDAFRNVLTSRNADLTFINGIEAFWDLPITTVKFEE